MESCAYAEVIVDIAHSNIDRIFDYKIEDGRDIPPGSRVRVPFGRAYTEGIVLRCKQETALSREKIRPLGKCLDERPVVTLEQIRLAQYICAKYRTTMAFALRLMFPAKLR